MILIIRVSTVLNVLWVLRRLFVVKHSEPSSGVFAVPFQGPRQMLHLHSSDKEAYLENDEQDNGPPTNPAARPWNLVAKAESLRCPASPLDAG